MNIKERILSDLNIEELSVEDIKEVPKEYNGEYAVACFKLAKKDNKEPNTIAIELANKINFNGIIEKLIPLGPYLNIVLNKKKTFEFVLKNIYKNENYGKSLIGISKNICIDYSSITLSKQFHIGHLCTTVIGACLSRLYEYNGYEVIKINYLGDMGTPFGKIITMYKMYSDIEKIKKKGISEIQRLYSLFDKEKLLDASLIETARNWSLKIEKGDTEAINLTNLFKKISLEEAKTIYNMLSIEFDDWRGEMYYNSMTKNIISMLEKKNLIYKSEGAKCIDLTNYEKGVCLIEKEDGGSLYVTRDLAAAIDRYEEYNFFKCLYVTGVEQSHHFSSVFQILDLAGYYWAKDLIHISYGRISTKYGKISGREGNTPLVMDIFNESIKKASLLLNEKGLSDQTAIDIGISTIVFNILKTEKNKNSVFDLETSLSFQGDTSVYIQYSYVRLLSVLEKINNYEMVDIDCSKLKYKEEFELLLLLDNFPEKVSYATKQNEPFIIARYALELATLVNQFYSKVKIIDNDKSYTILRCSLCEMAALVLRKTMEILGLKVVSKM